MTDSNAGDQDKAKDAGPETESEATGNAEKPPSPPKSSSHWVRNTIYTLIGVTVVVAAAAIAGFGLFARFDPRDPNPPATAYAPDRDSGTGAYYRIRLDFVPRQEQRMEGTGLRHRIRQVGATMFDEGLRTSLSVELARRDKPARPLATWTAQRETALTGDLVAFDKSEDPTVAVAVNRSASPNIRWGAAMPQWLSSRLAAMVPRSVADQPPLIRIAPPAAGQDPAVSQIVIRDYKGVAVGDLYVSSEWRPSVIFPPDLLQSSAARNPAIEDFLTGKGDTAARSAALVAMMRPNDAAFPEITAVKSWVEQRFRQVLEQQIRYIDKPEAVTPQLVESFADSCATTFDTAMSRYGLSVPDAALLTYFVHRDEPSFHQAGGLDNVCGRPALAEALLAAAAPPPEPVAAVQAEIPPKTEPPAAAPEPAPVVDVARTPLEILDLLAREWKSGLSADGRQHSHFYIREDAVLARPNRFNLFPPAPLTGRDAILVDHEANPLRHFACFMRLADNSVSALLERNEGGSGGTAVYYYRFFFDEENRIYNILRREALQEDINEVLVTLADSPCTREFLIVEEARLRQVIGGASADDPAPPAPDARDAVQGEAPTIVEATRGWRNPGPRGRLQNRVKVDFSVLDAIPRNTLLRDGG